MYKIPTLLFLLILIAGCNNSVNHSNSDKTSQQYNIEKTDIKIADDLFQTARIKEDLDGDGSKEIISLYLGPILNKEDKVTVLPYDERHIWQLIVYDGNDTFPLFNKSVQSDTNLDFWIEYTANKKEIVVFIDGENKSIASYTYDKENNRFVKEIKYKSEGQIRGISPAFQKVD
ncbi:hypothetical protein [Guptibacillus hwajinpoensis]|uniref:hypothetical protein n=1 Tax=Guptibacillus hwajinpoensis TaxID=208199 RepID=UPI003D02FE1C